MNFADRMAENAKATEDKAVNKGDVFTYKQIDRAISESMHEFLEDNQDAIAKGIAKHEGDVDPLLGMMLSMNAMNDVGHFVYILRHNLFGEGGEEGDGDGE